MVFYFCLRRLERVLSSGVYVPVSVGANRTERRTSSRLSDRLSNSGLKNSLHHLALLCIRHLSLVGRPPGLSAPAPIHWKNPSFSALGVQIWCLPTVFSVPQPANAPKSWIQAHTRPLQQPATPPSPETLLAHISAPSTTPLRSRSFVSLCQLRTAQARPSAEPRHHIYSSSPLPPLLGFSPRLDSSSLTTIHFQFLHQQFLWL